MAFPWMAAAIAGTGALSALGGKSAADKQADLYRSILRALKGLQGEQRVAGRQALGYRQNALDATRAGTRAALGETERLGEAAELDARELATREMGAAQQDLVSRGMFNPDALRFSRMGIQSNLARNLSALSERHAALRSQIHLQGAGAEAAGLGDLASQTSANFAQRADLVGAGLNFQSESAPFAQDPSQNLGWLFAALGAMNKPDPMKQFVQKQTKQGLGDAASMIAGAF